MRHFLPHWFQNQKLDKKLWVLGMVMVGTIAVVLVGFLLTVTDLSRSVSLVRQGNILNTKTRQTLEIMDRIRDGSLTMLVLGRDMVIAKDDRGTDYEDPSLSLVPRTEVEKAFADLDLLRPEESSQLPLGPFRQKWDRLADLVSQELPEALARRRAAAVNRGDEIALIESLLLEAFSRCHKEGRNIQASFPPAATGLFLELEYLRSQLLVALMATIDNNRSGYLETSTLSHMDQVLEDLFATHRRLEALAPRPSLIRGSVLAHGQLGDLVRVTVVPAMTASLDLMAKADLEVYRTDFQLGLAFQELATQLDAMEKVMLARLQDSAFLVGDHVESLMDKVNIVLFIDILLLGVALFLMVSTLWLLSRSILTPLKGAIHFAGRVAEGDFDLELDTKRQDELGALARSLSTMADKIKESTHKMEYLVELRTEELATSLEQLHETQDQLIKSERLASMTPLLFGVAHELNTPLGNCLSAVSYLQNAMTQPTMGLTKQAMEDSLKVTTENLERSIRLINDFSGLSLIQRDDELKPCDLAAEVTQVFQWVTGNHHLKHGELRLSLPPCPALSLPINGFRGIIERVLKNSLDHWVEAPQAPSGATPLHPLVTVEVMLTGSQGLQEIRISDNGPGLEPGVLSRLGEPFVTTARHRGHTGLGLYVVRSLMEQRFKGTIHLESPEGGGCTVVLKFA